ncbi:SUF system NifU family Fe-S cluster assembly protein [Candidatus Woesearchaeota archaeon]|nr:SUF system NifU family Fe-S cluster assembly protein [Candidatus Woesearchaeota archaeon]
MSFDELYREQIMDHYKNPRNHGILEPFTFKFFDNNPLCGDEIEVRAFVEGNVIKDVKFTGKGCSISQAAASMLSETVKGKTLSDVQQLTRDDVIEMLGIPIGPVRVKCAVLSLVALKNGIIEFQNGVNKNG